MLFVRSVAFRDPAFRASTNHTDRSDLVPFPSRVTEELFSITLDVVTPD